MSAYFQISSNAQKMVQGFALDLHMMIMIMKMIMMMMMMMMMMTVIFYQLYTFVCVFPNLFSHTTLTSEWSKVLLLTYI